MRSALMLRRRKRRLRGWSFNRMVPNSLTVIALCAGLTSIRFSLEGRWELAVLAVVVAGIFDVLDGGAARLLKGTSKFGAELDSLSDFISFGAAPAVLVYQWTLSDIAGLGWAFSLLFAVCCALRLARFNTEIERPSEDAQPMSRDFFVGVPAPGGAGLAMLPVMVWLEFGADVSRLPAVNVAMLSASAFLMISHVPTFSFKRITVPHRYVLPALLLVGLGFASLVSAPWPTLITVGLLYIASLPWSVIVHRRARMRHAPSASVEPFPVDRSGRIVASAQDKDSADDRAGLGS